MAITILELKVRIGIGSTNTDKDALLTANLAEAVVLVDVFLGSKKVKVPAEVYEPAVLRTAQELYYRDTRGSSSGGQINTEGNFTGGYMRKDPMHFVYPMLHPFVGWF